MQPQLAGRPQETAPIAFSPIEAATMLGISRATLDRQIKAGSIKALRLGTTVRISQREIDRLAAGKTVEDLFAELPVSEQPATLKRLVGMAHGPGVGKPC